MEGLDQSETQCPTVALFTGLRLKQTRAHFVGSSLAADLQLEQGVQLVFMDFSHCIPELVSQQLVVTSSYIVFLSARSKYPYKE